MSKTILITGSTDGIGKLVASKLATDGHRLYLHGRNQDKLNTVIGEIKAIAQNDQIKGFVADFSDLEDVRKMAAQVNGEITVLDVLINNAGVYKSPNPKTLDNFDIRFSVNYLAPYLLTNELLPLLKNSASPRLINLSSAAQAQVSLSALAGDVSLSIHEAYAQSKLALTMWSQYLASAEPGLNVIAVNPGSLLNTKMVREGFGRIWSSADKGANILYDLAVSEKYKNASGKYFDNDSGDFGPIHPAGTPKESVIALIEKTKELLRVI